MPPVAAEVTTWGDDPELAKWLTAHAIPNRPASPATADRREVILVAGAPPAGGGPAVWADLARRIARGSTAVFLTPATLARQQQPTGWLPLARKGSIAGLPVWLYHKDDWCKRHPIFDGLPAPGLMDYAYYREIIPDGALVGQDPPAEAVAGGLDVSWAYSSGLFVAVYDLAAGRFIVNTLYIRERLGTSPPAERLLRNMLRYAARDAGKPPAELPSDFDQQLKAMGY